MPRLADVFGRFTVAEVESSQSGHLLSAFSKPNLAELEKLLGYASCYKETRRLKLVLEEIGTSLQDQVIQVKTCLRKVEDYRANGQKQLIELVFLPLIDQWFVASARWDKSPQELYVKYLDYIFTWKYFFLYTNRGTPQTNNDFSRLINHVFGSKFDKVKEQKNCVARIIQRVLTSQGLEGFFDEENLQCGDEIPSTVKNYCSKTYSMVQFVENASFNRAPNETNWCWEEYHEFCETRKKIAVELGETVKNYFVITPPVDDTKHLIPKEYPKEYDPWVIEIGLQKAIRLLNRRLPAWEMSEAFDPIAAGVKKLRDSFIDHVLRE